MRPNNLKIKSVTSTVRFQAVMALRTERPNTPTTETQQIIPIKRSFVELIDLHEILAVDVFSQGPLSTGLVGDQGLQHGAHHVQLSGRGAHVTPRNLDLEASVVWILFSFQRGIGQRFHAPLPICACFSH